METPVDQLYAQVDKKPKKKKENLYVMSTSQPLEKKTHTPVDQLYAQVDKKKSKKNPQASSTSQPLEMETPVDQLYAQVDKKKSKEKEVCPEESGAVYSVVNKPHPPQLS